MVRAGFYKMEDHLKGDTFDGVTFNLTNKTNGVPIDLTGCVIRAQFRKGVNKGALIKDVTTSEGVTIMDAANGVFSIDSFLLNWDAAIYNYDVQFTFSNGVVKTYIKGTIKITQDSTY